NYTGKAIEITTNVDDAFRIGAREGRSMVIHLDDTDGVIIGLMNTNSVFAFTNQNRYGYIDGASYVFDYADDVYLDEVELANVSIGDSVYTLSLESTVATSLNLILANEATE